MLIHRCELNIMTNNNVKSAVRTLRILECFESARGPMSLGEVSSSLSIPKSSTHTLVYTLIAEGYLEKISHNAFSLNTNLKRQPGWVGGINGPIRRTAGPEMDRLLELFEESVVLGVPMRNLNVQIEEFRQSKQLMSYSVKKAPSIPGWCTSLGHAILSHLPQDIVYRYIDKEHKISLTSKTLTSTKKIMDKLAKSREQGYALNVDERFDGASGVAVPILDSLGNPKAALNMVMLTPRFFERKDIIIKEVRHSVSVIEKKLFPKEQRTNIVKLNRG